MFAPSSVKISYRSADHIIYSMYSIDAKLVIEDTTLEIEIFFGNAEIRSNGQRRLRSENRVPPSLYLPLETNDNRVHLG